MCWVAGQPERPRRSRVLFDAVESCVPRDLSMHPKHVQFLVYFEGLTRKQTPWLERARRESEQITEFVELVLKDFGGYLQLTPQDGSKVASYINRHPAFKTARPDNRQDIMDAVYCKVMGDEEGFNSCMQEMADFEEACELVLSYRRRVNQLTAEDATARSLVRHNITASIGVITKKLPMTGKHLKES